MGERRHSDFRHQFYFSKVKMKKSASIRKFACLLCLTLLYRSASAQIQKEWQDEDMDLFAKFQKVNRNDPKSVEGFFASREKYLSPDTLGFGWVKVQRAKPGGYTRILADLYYYKDSLYSYVIFSYLPDEEQLVSAYKPILRKLFPENSPYEQGLGRRRLGKVSSHEIQGPDGNCPGLLMDVDPYIKSLTPEIIRIL